MHAYGCAYASVQVCTCAGACVCKYVHVYAEECCMYMLRVCDLWYMIALNPPPPIFISNVLYIILWMWMCVLSSCCSFCFLLVVFVVFVLSFVDLWLFSFDVWGDRVQCTGRMHVFLLKAPRWCTWRKKTTHTKHNNIGTLSKATLGKTPGRRGVAHNYGLSRAHRYHLELIWTELNLELLQGSGHCATAFSIESWTPHHRSPGGGRRRKEEALNGLPWLGGREMAIVNQKTKILMELFRRQNWGNSLRDGGRAHIRLYYIEIIFLSQCSAREIGAAFPGGKRAAIVRRYPIWFFFSLCAVFSFFP